MNYIPLKKQGHVAKSILTVAFSLPVFFQVSAGEPRVTARGANHRAWESVREVALPDGRSRSETNSYIELQTGLHRWSDQGWVETNPKFEISVLEGGRAVANHLAYGAASFAPNLATAGAIDISLPEGRLQGHLLGLSYTEEGRSVTIAEVKDCVGVIGGPEQNELTFADAFTDFDISVKFVVQRDRISQLVTLHQQLPHPSEWGLTEEAALEVLTEFTSFPAVRKEPREGPFTYWSWLFFGFSAAWLATVLGTIDSQILSWIIYFFSAALIVMVLYESKIRSLVKEMSRRPKAGPDAELDRTNLPSERSRSEGQPSAPAEPSERGTH